MSDEPKFAMKRYEAAERTEYRIASRVFMLGDLCLDDYDEFCVAADKIIEKAIAEYYDVDEEGKPRQSKDGKTFMGIIRYIITEASAECADMWNGFFHLPEDEKVDAAWFRKTMTIPRLKKMWWQIVKDNGWESLAEGMMDKLLPFVWQLAKMKLAQIAANVPLEGPTSTTS